MADPATPEGIRDVLREELLGLGPLDSCALLAPRMGPNIGSHALWVAAVLALADVLKARIAYAAEEGGFSAEEMERRIGKGPIVFRGGYLGDFWGAGGDRWWQLIRHIITRYPDRPIIFLPYSLHVTAPGMRREMAATLNGHPRLTFMARDKDSFARARDWFPACRVRLAPDNVFLMAGLPGLKPGAPGGSSVFYLCRSDWRAEADFSAASLGVPNLKAGDWRSYGWKNPTGVRVPGLNPLLNRLGESGWLAPGEWRSRRRWMRSHSVEARPGAEPGWRLHRRARAMLHAGLSQLSQDQVVITNRMHGHILCVLLGIPHVVLPGPYGKMESFIGTWTKDLPGVRYVSEPREVAGAVKELLDSARRPAVVAG